ncbi:MAG: hypothetical protein JO097_11320 [Acidobacteriaceae bacterium]|nr:hypothetical protein [Acidobacteriaceae bacterium]MBV9294878.1 hypothetical protein [Acidobacteriaceae bacterium]MBV9767738.1 hypothetical protein [Acidobacteriaceae bacterium]
MKNIKSAFNSFWNNEQGQDLVEYSLLLGIFALGSTALLFNYRTAMGGVWTKLSTTLNAAS